MLTPTISTFMASHHKECDEQFALAEEAIAIASGDWELGIIQWQAFTQELATHFSREEEILFPEFESATGMTGGPTQMMRIEHEQMRALIREADKAAETKDQEQFLALTETLMITMQQHNMKEEQILYPMTDQSLPDAMAIIERMREN